MLKMLVDLIIFLFGASLVEIVYAESYCRDSSLSCMSNSELQNLIHELHSKYEKIQTQQLDSNCSICNVIPNPCLNGGTCLSQSCDQYICDCPQNYTGNRCEEPLVCTPDSCGPNAECNVFNHRVNCICKLGYTGDPYSRTGCNKTIVTSCLSGDPHYYSYDRNFFDYQGTCPYTVSKNCHSIEPYADYVIKARNQLTNPKAHVSTVVEVEVETHGVNIHIDQKLRLYVNGTLKNYNFYYPNQQNPMVSVENNFGQVEITSVDGVQVVFKLGYLCVSIPDVPELQGPTTLCGLLGNRDRNCSNDIALKNGTILTDDNKCKHSADWQGSEIFGDSWIINKTDFLNTIGDYYCETGQIVTNKTLNCSMGNARNACQPILDAADGQGIFQACSLLGYTILDHLYEDCVFDVCMDPGSRCPTLTAFVDQCQSEIPFANIGDWRKETQCPAYYCPVDSTYSPCASKCQPTCSFNNTVLSHCIDSCYEGCLCNPGYVIDTTSDAFKCILPKECGCVDASGNTYPTNSTWLDKNCTIKYYCENGTIIGVPNQCSGDQQCVVENGIMQCKCPKNSSVATECDEGWTYYDKSNKCYKLFHNQNCNDSETTCVNHDGHLASIHSLEEEEFLSEFSSSGLDFPNDGWWGRNQVGIGLINPKLDGHFFWSDGSPYDYENWCTGGAMDQPNKNWMCTALVADLSVKNEICLKKWISDADYVVHRAFICQKDASSKSNA